MERDGHWRIAGGAHRDDHAALASRVSSPGGAALAMCPALLDSGEWFAILVVVPFTLAAVIPARC